MRYQTRRSALSGIVQSLLITRHMLFVGFSLRDDNFHRIVDEVRRSVQEQDVGSSPSAPSTPAKPNGFSLSPPSTPTPSTPTSSTSIPSPLAASRRTSYSPVLQEKIDSTYRFGTQLSLSENPATGSSPSSPSPSYPFRTSLDPRSSRGRH